MKNHVLGIVAAGLITTVSMPYGFAQAGVQPPEKSDHTVMTQQDQRYTLLGKDNPTSDEAVNPKTGETQDPQHQETDQSKQMPSK